MDKSIVGNFEVLLSASKILLAKKINKNPKDWFGIILRYCEENFLEDEFVESLLQQLVFFFRSIVANKYGKQLENIGLCFDARSHFASCKEAKGVSQRNDSDADAVREHDDIKLEEFATIEVDNNNANATPKMGEVFFNAPDSPRSITPIMAIPQKKQTVSEGSTMRTSTVVHKARKYKDKKVRAPAPSTIINSRSFRDEWREDNITKTVWRRCPKLFFASKAVYGATYPQTINWTGSAFLIDISNTIEASGTSLIVSKPGYYVCTITGVLVPVDIELIAMTVTQLSGIDGKASTMQLFQGGTQLVAAFTLSVTIFINSDTTVILTKRGGAASSNINNVRFYMYQIDDDLD